MTILRRYRFTLAIAFAAILLFGLRTAFPERALEYLGPRAILDSSFALLLVFLILLIGLGTGMRIQRFLTVNVALRSREQILFGIPLGLGVIAYGTYLLALANLLSAPAILLWLIAAGSFSGAELKRIWPNKTKLASLNLQSFAPVELWKRLILATLLIIFLFALAQTLSPPTDPDGLIDHLAVPKLLLAAGRVIPMQEFVFANYPLTLEMLFAIGMAFGSDVVAKLLHLSFGTLLIVAIYMLGARYFSNTTGWIAAAMLVGMPIFPIWASLAYVDMAWALYAFLMTYALVIWNEGTTNQNLILAGLMAGFALGTKYLALGGVGIAGLWIIWRLRQRGVKEIYSSAMIFAAPAVLVGGLWYVRNLLTFGNPVYPYFSANSSGLVANYEGFGIFDYVMLPINLFLQRELFVGVYGTVEFPSILFLLAFLYPFTNRSAATDALAGLTLLRYIVWSAISHWRFRYLLPAMPGISLLSAHVAVTLISKNPDRKWIRIAAGGLLGGMLAVTMVYSVLRFTTVQPWRAILGIESKASFLRREVSDYAAKEYIQSALSSEARVFMPWNARSYYCNDRCVPDWLRSEWRQLVANDMDPQSVAAKLAAMGATHLLLSSEDIDYSVVNDQSGSNLVALEFLLDEFRSSCTKEIYHDEWTMLLELDC